jgi:hypothetical protein
VTLELIYKNRDKAFFSNSHFPNWFYFDEWSYYHLVIMKTYSYANLSFCVQVIFPNGHFEKLSFHQAENDLFMKNYECHDLANLANTTNDFVTNHFCQVLSVILWWSL